MRQTVAQRRIVRKIQRWLSRHEYQSGYGFKLHRCGEGCLSELSEYALCRSGVVVAKGHGCYIDPWVNYSVKQLNELWKAARACDARMDACQKKID